MWGMNILMKLLDSLPRPARVAAFFLVLIVSIYLALVPQFVNGFVYFKDGKGGKLPYRGGEIVVAANGHDYKNM
ncbi:MAG TPA: hypothetical protein VKD04_00495 [Burkholderiales bacterium]|nr:hypothetical protein [Burkholderiales bacterium]